MSQSQCLVGDETLVVQNFVCSVCGKIFDSETTIIAHTLHSHQNEPHVQSLKSKLSNNTRVKCSKLKDKNKSNTRRYKTEYKCESCTYTTIFLSTFNRHILTHKKGSRIHECSYCSYASIQHYNLKRHIKDVHPFGAVQPVLVIREST